MTIQMTRAPLAYAVCSFLWVISTFVGSPRALSADEGQVLRHAVFFKFKESSSESDVDKVVKAFAALPEKIDSISSLKSNPMAATGIAEIRILTT